MLDNKEANYYLKKLVEKLNDANHEKNEESIDIDDEFSG